MIFLNIGILAVIALGVWWLTGIDKNVSGESKRDRHFSRALRCGAVVFLVAAFLWLVEGDMGYGGIPLLLIIPVSIALLLRSSLSELFAGGFLQLIDPTIHDDREFDLKRNARYLNTIAYIIHNGRKDDAIKLCEELKKSGEVDIVTLEATLEFLGVKPERAQTPKPLAEAARLRAEGKFSEAEQLLKSLLAKNPADTGAAMMLMRVHAEDLRQPGKAHEVLHALEKQPHVDAGHVEFARRSIGEWSRPKAVKTEAAAPPESVDELLAQKLFGTAIDLLEEKIKTQPQDFDLRLKLAEVHAAHCKNFRRAEKIISEMEADCSPQQVASARAQLKAWRAA
jgi:tetratricopeptide (TPR) repeat protein